MSRTQQPNTLVVGASGLVGCAVVAALIQHGHRVFGMARDRQGLDRLMTLAPPDNWIPVSSCINDATDHNNGIDGILASVDNVVYAAGSLFPGGKKATDTLYHLAPSKLAARAKQRGVKHFVLISALGVGEGINSHYMTAKHKGENAVLKHFPNAVILRPGLIYSRSAGFFKRMANMASTFPMIVLPYGGKARIAAIDDLSVAKTCCLVLSTTQYQGQRIQLSWKDVMTVREMLKQDLHKHGISCRLIGMPGWLFWPLALLNDMLRMKILSRDQLRMLKTDILPAPAEHDVSDKLEVNARRPWL